VAWLVFTLALVPALVLVAILDLTRPYQRFARCRAVLAFWWLLFCEGVGLALALMLWLAHLVRRDQATFIAWNAALQRLWTEALFRGACKLYGLKVEVEDEDLSMPAPYLLLVRHASVLDTLLAATLIANPHKIVLRYVLKRELRWDPCLDVVGGRMHNVFVSRGKGVADSEAALRSLSQGLSENEGVLIYPEGTRFTFKGSERAKARASKMEAGEIRTIAGSLRHILPPKTGGTLALLEGNSDVDVVILEHTGLEAATTLREFWQGQFVGATLRARLRRISHKDIPLDPGARALWLHRSWQEVDDWIEEEEKSGRRLKRQVL
jgi:1-acyl-sn-glycerol-3-phosphate acyltransferase